MKSVYRILRRLPRRSARLSALLLFLAVPGAEPVLAAAKAAGGDGTLSAATDAAAAADADPVRELLIERLLNLGAFQARFVQFVEGARGEVVEESSGMLSLDRPRLRWEVNAPYPQVILADRTQLRIYDPDLAQLLVKPMAEALKETPVALLTQEQLSLSDRYDVVHLPASSDEAEEVFLLTPRDQASLFQEVRLHFRAQALSQMLIFDQLGQYTTVKFERLPGDGMLDSAVFTLDLPEDVDVIEG